MSEEKDFCGLWKQGKDEESALLICVFDWRWESSTSVLGNSSELFDELWVRAEVIKQTGECPKTFERVLPKKDHLLLKVISHCFQISREGHRTFPIIEFTGRIYGADNMFLRMPLRVQNIKARDITVEVL